MSEHKQREAQMTALIQRVTTLENALDQNTAVFADSLKLTEIYIQALQRALDDTLTGTVRMVEATPGVKVVDFKAYIKDVIAARDALDKAVQPLEDAPEPQTVFEFGG